MWEELKKQLEDGTLWRGLSSPTAIRYGKEYTEILLVMMKSIEQEKGNKRNGN